MNKLAAALDKATILLIRLAIFWSLVG